MPRPMHAGGINLRNNFKDICSMYMTGYKMHIYRVAIWTGML